MRVVILEVILIVIVMGQISRGPSVTSQGCLSTGSGAGAASSQCLLSYLGLEKTLWGAHLLDVVSHLHTVDL